MPIAAINLTDNVTKGINFEGHERNRRSRAQRIATPVATAMLVMTPVQAEALRDGDVFIPSENHIEYVEAPKSFPSQGINDTIKGQKIFVGNTRLNDGTPAKFYNTWLFVNSDYNTNNFERVYDRVSMEANGRVLYSENFEVKNLVNLKGCIVSDDKSVGNRFETSYYTYDNATNDIATDKKVLVEGLKKALSSSQNNSNVKVYNTNFMLAPDYNNKRLGVVKDPSSIVDRMKSAKAVDMSMFNKAGSDRLQGDNGNYEITYYSQKGGNTVKYITVKKDGYPELVVSENYLITTELDDEGDIEPLKHSITILADENHKPIMLCDRKLAYSLGKIYMNDIVEKSAFQCENLKHMALTTRNPDGTVSFKYYK